MAFAVLANRGGGVAEVMRASPEETAPTEWMQERLSILSNIREKEDRSE